MLPLGCIKECRGCKHREWTKEESLAQKFSFLASKLSGWNKTLAQVTSVDDEHRWHYRGKTTLSAQWNANGWQFGMISRDELIPIYDCPLHKPEVNSIVRILRDHLPSGDIFPLAYYVQTSAQVVLVLKSKVDPEIKWLIEDVIAELRSCGVEGLWIHLNPSAGRRMFEKTKWVLLFGEKRSKDINGLWYGPGAFQQLIPKLYNKSLDEASIFLEPNQRSAIVDLYCGTGSSMKRWTDAGSEVIGVEVGVEAIECAKLNVFEATILRGACRQRIPQIRDWVNEKRGEGKIVLLYVNPPRTGIEQEVLDWIINDGKPDRIAYLSCSAGTLSKNLKVLTSNGYQVIRLTPYDFFPQTIHVECLALLERM